MITNPNIALVGFMGTGKTSVGTALAAELGMTFLDMDDEIERRQKRRISDIFANEGEPFFRELERALVQELAGQTGLVIGTGGGIVLNQDNVDDFARTGVVICLRATPETILERVSKETHRPLLHGGDMMAKIRAIYDVREALYNAIPLGIDTDGMSLDEVVAAAAALYSANRTTSSS